MSREILLLVDALSREKNVDKEIVFESLESALASATKKRFADEADVQPEAVEVLVHRLRKRLEGSGVRISTLRGLGYVLEPDNATPGTP